MQESLRNIYEKLRGFIRSGLSVKVTDEEDLEKLVAMPNLMPLISRAKATEAQQQLTFLHSLEKSYFYTYSRYSDDLEELGFEQTALVTDGGNANYRIEVVEAGENGFKAQAVSVVDFDKDGVFNVWEIDQDQTLKETVKD